jgi:hypothetical protein
MPTRLFLVRRAHGLIKEKSSNLTDPPRGSVRFQRQLNYFSYPKNAPQSALNVIEAKAHFDGLERLVHIRVGGLDGRLYLDLGDETWRAVEIDATGWRVINNPPVQFRRASGMKPMPIPSAADRSRRCDPSSPCNPTPISFCWSLGRLPSCAIAAPIR